MPKPKWIKNPFKQAMVSSSIEPSSHPINSPLSSAPIVTATSQQSSQATTSSQVPSSKSCSSVPSSQPSSEVPSSRHRAPSSSKRKSDHYWLVDGIDEHGVTKKIKLNVKDVHNLPGQHIVVEFNEQFLPIGEAAGLLAGVLAQLATNSDFFPISFEKWSSIPKSFFEDKFNNVLKCMFHFEVDECHVRRFVDQSMSKMWRDYRIKLWNEFYNPTMSRDELINNHPENISIDQWATFIDYHLDFKTKALCKRNQEIQQKQTIPHTCGAENISRRRAEVEQIEEYLTQSLGNPSKISSDNALGTILEKEHSGCVRCLEMEAIPTIAFGNATTRFSSMQLGSSNAFSSSGDNQMQRKMMKMEVTLQALITLVNEKFGETIPNAIGRYCTNGTQAADLESRAPSTNNPNNLDTRSLDESMTHQSGDLGKGSLH